MTKGLYMTDQFTLERFQPYVNDTFQLTTISGQSLQANLIEAVAVGSPPAPNNGVTERQAFSLIFHIADAAYLEHQIFTLTHDTLSEMALFLVPIGQDSKGVKYEAMFT